MSSMIKQLFWDSATRRLRTLWRLLLHLVIQALCLGFGFALLALVLAVFFAKQGLADYFGVLQGNSAALSGLGTPFYEILSALTGLATVLLALWLAGRFLDRRRFADFGLHLRRAWWLDFLFGLLLGALLMTLIFVTEWLAGWVTVIGIWHTSSPARPFGQAILVPLVLFIGVGIYEELFSRGYQLKNLAEGFAGLWGLGPRGAIMGATLVSSAIFGLLHLGNPHATWVSTFNIFVAGIFLALGYILTGELGISMGLHIAWNFCQGNIFGFPVSGTAANTTTLIAIQQGGNALVTGGAFGPEAGLIGLAALIFGGFLICVWVRLRYGALCLHQPLTVPDLRFRPAPSTEPELVGEQHKPDEYKTGLTDLRR